MRYEEPEDEQRDSEIPHAPRQSNWTPPQGKFATLDLYINMWGHGISKIRGIAINLIFLLMNGMLFWLFEEIQIMSSNPPIRVEPQLFGQGFISTGRLSSAC